jgi:hypothetical protein
MPIRLDVIGLVALSAVALWAMHRRHRARVKADRAACFDDCLALFDDYRLKQDDVDFPVLEGRYRGFRARLEPVIDHIAVRKLPSLWLLVTIFGELPVDGTLDLLVRPQNTEFYSPSAGLPITLPLPPGWPSHALLRTDALHRLLPVDLLTPHILVFDDPKTKELVITPRGVRIVYQAGQGERAQYLVLRQAEFRDVRLPAELVERLLERAIAVYNSVAALR